MKVSRALKGLKTSSNIIPIINVSFCIIVILMQISPFLSESRVKIDMPEAVSTKDQEKTKITLIITKEGACILEDKEVKVMDLSEQLKKRAAVDLSQILLIKADKNVPYEWVRKIILIAKASGIPKVAIATQKKKEITAEK